MNMEEMIIDVFPDGTQTIEVNGVKGKKCTEITKFLEDEGNVIEDRITRAYTQSVQVEQKLTQRR